MTRYKTTTDNGLVKSIIVGAIGAAASYLAVTYTKKLLEEKPLGERIADVKAKAVDIKAAAQTKAGELKDAALTKVSSVATDLAKKADKEE